MPRRSDKNLPLRVRSLLKRGMRMLTPPEMKLSSKIRWKSILLGLLQQSVPELPHPLITIVKWSMLALLNHTRLLNRQKKFKREYPIG
jgi:hypothetical protein